MNSSKLISLLKTFSNKELKALKKFVESPFHNEQMNVTQLYQYIYEGAPQFNEKYLLKEKAWNRLYPKEKFKDIRLRRVMSDLLKICQDFVAWQMYKKNTIQVQTNLLKYYRIHQLPKQFNTVISDIEKHEKKNPKQDIWHHFHKLQVSNEITSHISQQHIRTTEPNLQEISDNLDAFYLINKLKCCCSIFNYQNLALAEYKVPMIREVLDHLSKKDYSHIPLVVIYHKSLLTLLDPDEPLHFQELKETLLKANALLAQEEVVDMFVLARNYCIKQANQGNKQYLHDLFDLYESELTMGILLNNGEIPPFTYKNIVTLAIKLQKYDWTKAFIEEYKVHLAKEFRESTHAFNLARLHFDKKEFEEVIALLNQMEYREIFLELSAKNLLMKTYYETEEFELLHSFLDSFQMFIRRKKKILGYHCTGYLNLIKATRQLVRLQYTNAEQIEKITLKLKNKKEIVDKTWVMEKLSLLV